jgi:hypothetical protein
VVDAPWDVYVAVCATDAPAGIDASELAPPLQISTRPVAPTGNGNGYTKQNSADVLTSGYINVTVSPGYEYLTIAVGASCDTATDAYTAVTAASGVVVAPGKLAQVCVRKSAVEASGTSSSTPGSFHSLPASVDIVAGQKTPPAPKPLTCPTGYKVVGTGSSAKCEVRGTGLVKWFTKKAHTDNNRFTDIAIETPGFRDDINWLYQYGITTGVTPTSYAPGDSVTRAQMAAFLHRLAGSSTYNQTSCGFVDIGGMPEGFKKDICWLKSTGVTKGVDNTHYDPNGFVTRAQMAAFMHRLVGSPAYNSTACGFIDVGGMSDGFKKDICWLRSTKVTTGINSPTSTLYAPDQLVTRSQMAAFMHRLYKWSTGEK